MGSANYAVAMVAKFMRIAVIGAGVSGLVAAYRLKDSHDVTVFEAQDRAGGHAHTLDVSSAGRVIPTDIGFMVFNEQTYPEFTKLLAELGVPSRVSTMSFSVRCARTGVQWNGSSLNGLFAQRGNALRPSFLRMLWDITRFNRMARSDLDRDECADITLGEYIRRRRFGVEFVEWYLVPMTAAIWSAGPEACLDTPFVFFARFFANHGMLNVFRRPVWRTVLGGSREYTHRLSAQLRICTGRAVHKVRRLPQGVELSFSDRSSSPFDAVILATHSDQALALLTDPSHAEREILSALPYQANEAILHTDISMLPEHRRAWAAWNYSVSAQASSRATLTYDLTRLQGLPSAQPLLLTLNDSESIDPQHVISRHSFTHPVFTLAGIRARARVEEIQGQRRTWYCGAYWGYGFHEDGVTSALRACASFAALTRREMETSHV